MSRLALGLVLALAFLTGCGGDDDEGGSGASTTEQFTAPPHDTEVDDVTCRELKGFQRRAEVARELAGEYITLEPETTLVPSFAAVLNAACEGAKPGTKPVPGIVEDADVARRRVLYDGSTPSFSDALFEETSEKDDAGEEGGAEPVGDGCEPSDQTVEPAAFGAALKKETGVKLASDRSPYYVHFDNLDTDSPHNDEFGFFSVYVMTKLDQSLDILTTGREEPDSEGIYWQKPDEGGVWSALKVCGANVAVSSSLNDKKGTDERWDALTSAVGNAIDAAGS